MNQVSVVIPSFNHARYIQQAVDSVLRQSIFDLELIVIDDGSTDGSLEYLKSIKDARYKLITQPNAGAHNAINRGLSIAQGDFLAILNSDDAFHPRRLEECLVQLRDGFDLVATWIEIIDENDRALGVKQGWDNMLPWHIEKPPFKFDQSNAFRLNLLTSNFVSTTSNIVFSRNLYQKTGGMKNLRFAHDWDFLLRAAKHFPCSLIEKPLLQYRVHKKNTISSSRAWMLFEICWMFAVHLGEYANDIFSSSAAENNINAVNFFANSINVQGNEKVLWMLLQYFDAQRKIGVVRPEEVLLDNADDREIFIKYITP